MVGVDHCWAALQVCPPLLEGMDDGELLLLVRRPVGLRRGQLLALVRYRAVAGRCFLREHSTNCMLACICGDYEACLGVRLGQDRCGDQRLSQLLERAVLVVALSEGHVLFQQLSQRQAHLRAVRDEAPLVGVIILGSAGEPDRGVGQFSTACTFWGSV